jgi:hypothetical protein
MSEEQKRQLNQQLWNIANTLRGKMDAYWGHAELFPAKSLRIEEKR